MASKSDRFYYQNFIEAAEYSCKAAEYLSQCVKDYHPENIREMLDKMHEFEHQADGIRHEMSVTLAKAFVTPIDREDLAELSQNIDEVTDKIEEVLQRFYIHHVKTILEEAVEFTRKIVSCCTKMQDMLKELPNFKKPERLHAMVIELNNAEEDCDRFYLDATMKIREHFTDVLEVVAWREIYDYLEDCADACEHVADSVEEVVMKNT